MQRGERQHPHLSTQTLTTSTTVGQKQTARSCVMLLLDFVAMVLAIHLAIHHIQSLLAAIIGHVIFAFLLVIGWPTWGATV